MSDSDSKDVKSNSTQWQIALNITWPHILRLSFKIFRIFTPIINSHISTPYLKHANEFVQILSLDQMLNNRKAQEISLSEILPPATHPFPFILGNSIQMQPVLPVNIVSSSLFHLHLYVLLCFHAFIVAFHLLCNTLSLVNFFPTLGTCLMSSTALSFIVGAHISF